jgi:AcrR family transcriptional regulator
VAEEVHTTRVALLDAGVALLRELTPTALVAALRTREIARRAGVSPPTFFHHFHSVDEYAAALVDHVFSPRRTSVEGVVTQGLREVQRLALPAEQSIAYHTRDLHRLAADPDHRIRLGLWALGGPAVDEAQARFVRAVDAQLLPQAQALHDVWGREVRPPLDLRSYLALQVAILSGSVVRHVTDPSVMTPERYARAAAALSLVLLRPKGDRRTMDDRLSEMNWYAGPRAVASTSSPRRDGTRGRIIDAAAELIGEYGYEATSITRVARTAGVHVATLYDHFESKAHLALALFDLQAGAHLAAMPPPDPDEPVAALRAHLIGIATLVATHTDLARLYLTVVACGDKPAAFDDVLRPPTLELVTAALCTGRDGALIPERATDHVLVAVIGATLRHPGDGPAGSSSPPLQVLGH